MLDIYFPKETSCMSSKAQQGQSLVHTEEVRGWPHQLLLVQHPRREELDSLPCILFLQVLRQNPSRLNQWIPCFPLLPSPFPSLAHYWWPSPALNSNPFTPKSLVPVVRWRSLQAGHFLSIFHVNTSPPFNIPKSGSWHHGPLFSQPFQKWSWKQLQKLLGPLSCIGQESV